MVMSSLLASMVSSTKKHWDKTTVKGMRVKQETLQLSATPKSDYLVVVAPAGVQIESKLWHVYHILTRWMPCADIWSKHLDAQT